MDDMPHDELVNWIRYFDTRPPGWQDDLRASLIMQSNGVKKQPHEIFASLAKLKHVENSTKISPSLLELFRNARGGDAGVVESWLK